MDINAAFQWKRYPEAEAFICRILDEACSQNHTIAVLSDDLLKHTSTRLFDWLDHIVISSSPTIEKELQDFGFVAESATHSYRTFHHPGAQFPRIVVYDHSMPIVGIAIGVEQIADFLMVRGLSGWIEGSPFSGYRRCCLSTDNQVSLWVVERRGTNTMEPTYNEPEYLEKYFTAKQLWQTRPRHLSDEESSLLRAITLAEEIVDLIGKDAAAMLILECERNYWQSRNTAGQLQKNRQDRLGMGWANHDHHTFRSSRRHFTELVRLFEILGFRCRERFYAGEEAGWGAQVMENPNCRLILFLDVDLAPNEIEINFAHQPLSERDNLGTVGLWCALHGDSILQAGMHHLEAQFMFDELSKDLSTLGVGMMVPFSDFSYLRQAFTKGENWPVDATRINILEKEKKITPEQAEKFLKNGAIGSHLENLQRREGYKGFNQKNVSFIIMKTDPRSIPHDG